MTKGDDFRLERFAIGGADGLLAKARRWHARAWARPAHSVREPRWFAAVVLKLDRIGDFVLALGAIRLVCERFGEENCALLVAPGVAELAAREFPRAERIVLPPFPRHKWAWRDWRRARRELAGLSCDQLFCLRHQRWDYHELALGWIRANRRHVIEDPRAARWVRGRRSVRRAAVEFVEVSDAEICRELAMHRALLSGAFGREVTMTEILPRLVRVGAGTARGEIAVVPFASAAIRDFPEELLIPALLAARVRLPGAKIALHGDAGQRARRIALVNRLRAAGVADVTCAPSTSVVEFAEAIAGAELVLSVESAGAHLAAALDPPAVSLIGGGPYGQFAPWRRSARQVWLTHRIDCFGCDWRCVHPEAYCLTGIGPHAMRAAVAQVLDARGVR